MEDFNIYDKIYPPQIEISRAFDRVYWEDIYGHEYLDLLGGAGCFFLWDFSDQKVYDIMSNKSFLSTTNFMMHDYKKQLIKDLQELTGYDIVFFVCGGAEATDAAMKLVWKYSYEKRKVIGRILYFSGSYHGMTLGSVRCGEKMLHEYLPYDSIFVECKFNELFDYNMRNVSGVIFESGLTASNHEKWDEQTLGMILQNCKENDIPIIADEIRIGLGKSGRVFASDNWIVKPDIITIGKSLAAGYPLTAVLADKKFSDVIDSTWYSSTAGGNPNLCRLGSYLIQPLFKKEVLEHVFWESAEMNDRLTTEFPNLKKLRCGKLWYLMPDNPMKVAMKLRENGVLVYCRSGNHIVLHPSLWFNQEDWEVFINVLRRSL